MRFERNNQVKAERRAVEEEVAQMEAERRAAAMKVERQVAAAELDF